MVRQGTSHIITTPHFAASLIEQRDVFEARLNEIDARFEELLAAVGRKFPTLRLEKGVELALDTPSLGSLDPRLRLGGGRFALVEFPFFAVPPNSAKPLTELKASGVTPIVAHPERYTNIDTEYAILREWRRCGAYLQLNAGSLLGTYGSKVERRAWDCLKHGLVDYVCSDYHSRGKCLLGPARDRAGERGATTHFKILSEYNSDRLGAGVEPLPVPPLQPQSRWQRLRNVFPRG